MTRLKQDSTLLRDTAKDLFAHLIGENTALERSSAQAEFDVQSIKDDCWELSQHLRDYGLAYAAEELVRIADREQKIRFSLAHLNLAFEVLLEFFHHNNPPNHLTFPLKTEGGPFEIIVARADGKSSAELLMEKTAEVEAHRILWERLRDTCETWEGEHPDPCLRYIEAGLSLPGTLENPTGNELWAPL